MIVRGHAVREASGNSPVCAAVTILTRTVVRTLEANTALTVRFNAPEEGVLDLEVLEIPMDQQSWLKGVSDLLYRGLRDLSGDAPGEIVVNEERST